MKHNDKKYRSFHMAEFSPKVLVAGTLCIILMFVLVFNLTSFIVNAEEMDDSLMISEAEPEVLEETSEAVTEKAEEIEAAETAAEEEEDTEIRVERETVPLIAKEHEDLEVKKDDIIEVSDEDDGEEDETEAETEEAEETEEETEEAHIHTADAGTVIKEATCTEDGIIEYHCAECGELLSTETIEAVGHHHSGMVVVQEASLSSDRIERDYCVDCGEVFEERVTSLDSIVAAECATRGCYGRLYLPAQNYSVAVFFSADWSNMQAIVDAEDSACMFNLSANTLIADHNGQGFTNTRDASEAVMVTSAGRQTYHCIARYYDGWNEGDHLATNDGTDISTLFAGKLITYTCNEASGHSVTISVWE